MVGPAGNCAKSNTSCQAYNYGYAAAEYAYLSARSQVIDSSMWWIDIELANTWSDTVSLNASVLSGALMYLHAHGITVGIYSVESNWTAIMGDTFTSMDTTLTDIPNWVVAYDEDVPVSSFCSQPFIVGSQVWLVQYTQEIFDGDYACDTN
jgi:hypothetical protein